jgi:hypothetical protein
VSDVAVYAWPQSVVAGDLVGVHASGPAGRAVLEVARVGAGREVVWSGAVDLEPRLLPVDVVARGCDWPVTATVTIGADWQSGYHEVVVRREGDPAAEAVGFLVVRAAEPSSDRPLWVLSTNTWNAYNDVGGENLYSTFGRAVAATHVSFRRPMAAGFLRRPEEPGQRAAVIDAPDPTMTAHVEYLFEHLLSEWVGRRAGRAGSCTSPGGPSARATSSTTPRTPTWNRSPASWTAARSS